MTRLPQPFGIERRCFMKPNLNIQELGRLLNDRGIYYLYHANAVETSLTYLKENALLSRQCCENRNLPQTMQKTDCLDKAYHIYNDLFFNLDDQHRRFKRPNEYGPILFHIKVEWLFDYLSADSAVQINITKKNPHLWNDGDSQSDRWFLTVAEAESSIFQHERSHPLKYYRKGSAWPDIVISNLSEGMSLDLISKIWLEEIPNNPNFHEEFVKKVGLLSCKYNQDRIIYREVCANGCKCVDSQEYEKENIRPKLDFGHYR